MNTIKEEKVDVLLQMGRLFFEELLWFGVGGIVLLLWSRIGTYGKGIAEEYVLEYMSAGAFVLFSAVFFAVFTFGFFIGDERCILKKTIHDLKVEYLKKIAGIYGGILGLVLPLVFCSSVIFSLVLFALMALLPLCLWFFYWLVDQPCQNRCFMGILMALIFVVLFVYTSINGFDGVPWIIAVAALASLVFFAIKILGEKYVAKKKR